MKITRERVLQVLGGKSREALTLRELLSRLGGGRHQQRALRNLLVELSREGLVERQQRRWRMARRDGLVEGTFGEGAGRGGSVVTDAGRVIAVPDGLDAQAGDRVLVRPGRERGQGALVDVIESERRQWIGIVNLDLSGAVITPYRDDREWGIHVPRKQLGRARDGDVVVLEVDRARGPGGALQGRVTRVLGRPGEPEPDFQAIVWHRRIPVVFPDAVLAEAEADHLEAASEEDARATGREDLRALPFVTIDPATARDHDDAVHVAPRPGGGFTLWVAIADVSHFVAEGGALDREALRRGNSVYFPDRAVPMLPERLSGDLCSLRDGVDRLAMAVRLEIDAEGAVHAEHFTAARIRSRASLHYGQAAALMEGQAVSGVDGEVAEAVRRLGALGRVLTDRRLAGGALDFELPQPEIDLDEDGMPRDVRVAERNAAHRAIEEAMLAANRAVATRLERAGVPALYRIHEPPLPGDADELREVLESFGLIQGLRGRRLETADVARALARVRGRPEERLVNLVALRAMQQARYSEENRGHFALAFDHYTHFTSPIRRYADLVVHRALKDLLAGGKALGRARRRGDGLDAVAARVSWRERVAMDAERDAVDLKRCAFMAPRIGEEFDGTVTGVAKHGLYVTLDPFFVEGLVHVSTLPHYVTLDPRAHALVARGSGARYGLGDRHRVVVDHVDPVKGWINFSLVESRKADAPSRRARGRR